MGLYSEAQQTEFVTSMRETARNTLQQLKDVFQLAQFGDNPESLSTLDRFTEEYLARGVVNEKNTNGYIIGLGTLLGDLLLQKFGGRWVIDKAYTLETRNAAGGKATLYPYTPVIARLKGDASRSISSFYFATAPRQLGYTSVYPAAGSDPPMLRSIRADTQAVMQTFGKRSGMTNFGFNNESVAYLDGLLDRTLTPTTPDATKEKLMNLFGAFLGECIVSRYGARWQFGPDSGPRLTIAAKGGTHFLDPFGKVAKRLTNGAEDSLSVYFGQLIPHVVGGGG